MDRLNERLVAGEAAHEAAWRLLLELLQRHGTQERFEERAVDYAITFELRRHPGKPCRIRRERRRRVTSGVADDAYYFQWRTESLPRFEDLPQIIEAMAQPVLDFAGHLAGFCFRRATGQSPGPDQGGRGIIIRSPKPSGRRTDGRCRPQQAGTHRRSQVLIQEKWSNITAPRSCRCVGAISSPWAATAR